MKITAHDIPLIAEDLAEQLGPIGTIMIIPALVAFLRQIDWDKIARIFDSMHADDAPATAVDNTRRVLAMLERWSNEVQALTSDQLSSGEFFDTKDHPRGA